MHTRPLLLLLLALLLSIACAPATAQEPAKPATPVGFDAKQWNAAIGLGGGAGGLYGKRRNKPDPVLDAGCAWLKNHQQATGAWSSSADDDAVARLTVTSVALLALLANGNTLRSGPHKEALKTGVNWLRLRQSPDGTMADPTLQGYATAHTLATLALTEAYFLSKYKTLKRNVVLANNWRETLRTTDGVFAAKPGGQPEIILTAWSHFADHAAHYAKVVEGDQRRPAIRAWLQQASSRIPEHSLLPVADSSQRDASRRAEGLAAVAMVMVWAAKEPEDIDADLLATVIAHDRKWQQGVNLHEWCCAAHFVKQKGSQEQLDKTLAPLRAAQNIEGEHLGSWDPIDLSGHVGGRTWTTAMALLTLTSPHRYTKMFR